MAIKTIVRVGRVILLALLAAVSVGGLASCAAEEEPPTAAETSSSPETSSNPEAARPEIPGVDMSKLGAPPLPGEDVRIAFWGSEGANPYTQVVWEEVQRTAEANNASADFMDPHFDARRMYTQLQDATTSGRYDAFIVWPIDITVLRPAIQEAIDAGIKVVAVNFATGPDLGTAEPQMEGVSGSVMPVARRDGQSLGELIVLACEGVDPCKVAHLAGFRTVAFDAAKIEEIEKAIEPHPNISLVSLQEGEYNRAVSREVAANVLQSHPDVNVFSSGGDQMTLGIERAADEAGIDGIKFIGSAASRDGIEAVRSGRWFATTVQLPLVEGLVSAEMAIKAVRGQPIDPLGVDTSDLSLTGPYITADTLERAQDFVGQWNG